MYFKIKFAGDHAVRIRFENPKPVNVQIENLQTVTKLIGGDPYVGPVDITPSDQKQVLDTNGKTMVQDIVVNPIPMQYGLVTYNQDRTITIT